MDVVFLLYYTSIYRAYACTCAAIYAIFCFDYVNISGRDAVSWAFRLACAASYACICNFVSHGDSPPPRIITKLLHLCNIVTLYIAFSNKLH